MLRTNRQEGVERCCGTCVHERYECVDGSAWCKKGDVPTNCAWGDDCDMWEDEETVRRHYIAVLLQANRWRRDSNVPSIYRMPDPKELGRAIDFAVDYMRGNFV